MIRIKFIQIIVFIVLSLSITQCDARRNEKPDSDHTIKFLVLGDWGTRGDSNQVKVSDQMAKIAKIMKPDFIMTTGDNFYPAGVSNTSDSHWSNSYENVYDDSSLFIPWYICLGNHDYGGNVQAEIDYSLFSPRWNLPSRYYHIDKNIDSENSLRLIFIDTSPFIKNYWAGSYPNVTSQDTSYQWFWIDSVLKNSTAKWNLIIGHHPIYSASTVHGDTPELVKRLKPMLLQYHVQAYMCGHEHDLQHLKLPNELPHYLLSGGGSQIRATGTDSITVFSAASLGFMAVEVSDDEMIFNFINAKGDTLHSGRIQP